MAANAPSPAQYLSHTAAMLKNAAPQEWERFIEAFGILADDVTVKVVEADAAVVLIAQGSARQMTGLLKTFVTCKVYTPPQAVSAAPPNGGQNARAG